jgi:hypothetical protein
MQAYEDTTERMHILEESINELRQINRNIAKLSLRKEALTNVIVGAFGHEKDGQKTYEHGMWKIEIRTPFIYSLNKKLYESGEFKLPTKFNPIKESVSYSIDKRLCEEYLLNSPEKVRNSLVSLIEKKPGKVSIAIKENV